MQRRNQQTIQSWKNIGKPVAIGFNFESQWWRGWHKFTGPIMK